MTLTVGSLFSGCGGFDMGFAAAGCRIAWACEIEPRPRAVFRRHHPGVPIYNDVREVRGDAIEPVDALIAGFPCQDVSIAGLRAGLAGERTGLFFEVVRIARDLRPRPRWLLLENVPGLLSSHKGRDMAAVLRELHGLGYRGGWRVLDLQWFGVPQRRRRVFFVLHLGDWRRAAEILFDGESLCGNPPPRPGAGQDVAGSIAKCSFDGGAGGRPEGAAAGHFVTHALRGEGFDASEDGTGRGIPLVARPLANCSPGSSGYRNDADTADNLICFGSSGPGWWNNNDMATLRAHQEGSLSTHLVAFDTTQITSQANFSSPKPGDPCHPLAAGAHAPCLAIGFHGSQDPDVSGDVSHPVGRNQGPECCVAYTTKLHNTQSNQAGKFYEDYAPGLQQNSPSPAMVQGLQVRRLTPLECERLMGWPDGYTAWGIDDAGRRVEMADVPRYRMCGNGVGRQHGEWLARRIVEKERGQ